MSALWAGEDDGADRQSRAPRQKRGGTSGHGARTAREGETSNASDPVSHRASTSQRRSEVSRTQLSRVPFVLVLIVIFGVGMAGLLALNTSLQGQSFEARKLHDRADKLSNRETALNRKAQDLRAPDRLADNAWKLGLRPNERHAVFKLPNGKIVGTSGPAQKNPIPGLKPSDAKKHQTKAEKKKADKKKADKKKEQQKRSQESDTDSRRPAGQGD